MPDSSIVQMDALDFLRGLPDGSVDLFLTDPPYESLRRWEGMGSKGRMGLAREGSEKHDPDRFYPTISTTEYLPQLLREAWRVLADNRHAYVMTDGITLPWVLLYAGMMEGVSPDGFAFDNSKILVWDKVDFGMGHHYRGRHEYIVMLDKGKNRGVNNKSVADVIRCKADTSRDLYPTAKPVALFKLLISQSTQPDELVVDPFVGSGTAAVAAALLKRRYLCADLQERAVRMATKRASSALLSRPLDLIDV